MNISRNICLWSVLAIAIYGCNVSSTQQPDQPSVYKVTGVKINQQLDIPERKARVYIEYGEETAWRDIARTGTHCSVLLQKVHSRGEPKLFVSPGLFEVTKVSRTNDSYFPGSFGSLTGLSGDPFPDARFDVEMRLKSAEQPDVRALICTKRTNTAGIHYPTVIDIRNALEGVIEINTP